MAKIYSVDDLKRLNEAINYVKPDPVQFKNSENVNENLPIGSEFDTKAPYNEPESSEMVNYDYEPYGNGFIVNVYDDNGNKKIYSGDELYGDLLDQSQSPYKDELINYFENTQITSEIVKSEGFDEIVKKLVDATIDPNDIEWGVNEMDDASKIALDNAESDLGKSEYGAFRNANFIDWDNINNEYKPIYKWGLDIIMNLDDSTLNRYLTQKNMRGYHDDINNNFNEIAEYYFDRGFDIIEAAYRENGNVDKLINGFIDTVTEYKSFEPLDESLIKSKEKLFETLYKLDPNSKKIL